MPVGDAPRVVSDGLVRHQPILSRAEILRQGAEAIMRLASGHSWNDWVKVMWALDIARTAAMLEAGINKPTGRKYSEAFARWLRCHNDFELIGKLDKSDRSRLFECLQSLDAINTWRASLPPHRLLKLNYPPTVLSRWKQNLQKHRDQHYRDRRRRHCHDHPRDGARLADRGVRRGQETSSGDRRPRTLSADRLRKLLTPTVAAEITDRILKVATDTASSRPKTMGRALGQLLSHVDGGDLDGARAAADGLRRLIASDDCDPSNIREARIKTAKRAKRGLIPFPANRLAPTASARMPAPSFRRHPT